MTQPACFIIAPIGAKLSALANVIIESGWRVLNFEADAVATSRLGFADMIARADAAIVVDPGVSPNLLIETGFALGRGIPVLLIVVEGEALPEFQSEPSLARLPRVRAKINDTTALRFHVPAFLDGVAKVPGPPLPPPPLSTLPKSTPKARATYPVSPLEQRLLDLFERSTEVMSVTQNPYRSSAADPIYRPDFAVWLADERSIVVNPVLVDVTRRLSPNELAQRLPMLRHFVRDASAGLLLLVEDDPALPLTLAALSPIIVRIGLVHLQHLLETGQLVRSVTEARNRAVHGLE